MLKALVIAAAMFVAAPAFAEVLQEKTFEAADGKPMCIDAEAYASRLSTLVAATPPSYNIRAIADSSTEDGDGKNIWEAIKKVSGLPVSASHFAVILATLDDGQMALISYGNEDDEFCRFLSFSAAQWKQVNDILESDPA